MRYASVCSGIEAASVAWKVLGWEPAWFSEIDPFACALLEQRHAGVPNLGDMTKIREEQLGRFDLLVGGTPCQSFSVAGLRKGLDDPRGNLALRFLQLAHAARPRWVVWENVPGVLSSGEGRDFGSILGGLAECGYGWAYRVLDAQYVRVDGFPRAVPQRRNRVFVVGYLGDWRRAAAVLFERACLRGDHPPRREAGERVAGTPDARAEAGGFPGTDGACNGHIIAPKVSPALKARDGKGPSSDGDGDGDGAPLVAHTLSAEGADASEDGTGRWTPLVPIGYISPRAARNSESCNELGIKNGELHDALSTDGPGAVAFDWYSSESQGMPVGDFAPPLKTTMQPAVAFAQNQRDEVRMMHTAGALASEPGMKQQTYASTSSGVRRLTPRECERLQGFATCIQRTTLDACYDHPSNSVRVEIQCRRWQSDASPADESGSGARVAFADSTLQNDPESRGALVAVHVRTSFDAKAVAIRSLGRFLWCAGGADRSGWCLPRIPAGSFAAGIAAAAHALDRSTTDGKAASQPPTKRFTLPAHGRWLAAMFGQGSGGSASGADAARIEATKFITESHTPRIQHSDSTEAIWLSFAMDAMTSFIPNGTPLGPSCRFVIDEEIDYTLITYRKKPAADAPRYRAIGNSMACNVMRWIGRRIAIADAIPVHSSP